MNTIKTTICYILIHYFNAFISLLLVLKNSFSLIPHSISQKRFPDFLILNFYEITIDLINCFEVKMLL